MASSQFSPFCPFEDVVFWGCGLLGMWAFYCPTGSFGGYIPNLGEWVIVANKKKIVTKDFCGG